ncbi:MAG: hypothetical protein HOG79_07180, partial [Prolixibacteraceae bacterium]|nr:hypothetical protein [Prolixibacteraceae bacterium]
MEKSLLDELRDASRTSNTRKNIENWCRIETDEYGKKGKYIEWCKNHHIEPYPCSVSDFEEFLISVYEDGLSIGSIKQARWAVDSEHKRMDFEPPGQDSRIEILLAGIIRTKVQRGEGTINQKDAMTMDHIKKIKFPNIYIEIRDRALLLIGFAGGFRKSELIRIQIQDIKKIESAINIELPFSKSNQQAEKIEKIAIVYGSDPDWCPILSLLKWLELINESGGRVFRSINKFNRNGKSLSHYSVPMIIKKY